MQALLCFPRYCCVVHLYQPAGPREPLLANTTTVWNKQIQEALPKAKENGYWSGAMTKWIKLQSSVGSRAAERMRQEGGGGGEEVEELEEETKGRRKGRDRGYWRTLPKPLPCRLLSFSLILLINSPPSSSVQSSPACRTEASPWSSCSYEPNGFRGIAGQGIIIFYSAKAAGWKECQVHAGSERRCTIMNTEAKLSCKERKCGRRWLAVCRSLTCLVWTVNLSAVLLKPLCAEASPMGLGVCRE